MEVPATAVLAAELLMAEGLAEEATVASVCLSQPFLGLSACLRVVESFEAAAFGMSYK